MPSLLQNFTPVSAQGKKSPIGVVLLVLAIIMGAGLYIIYRYFGLREWGPGAQTIPRPSATIESLTAGEKAKVLEKLTSLSSQTASSSPETEEQRSKILEELSSPPRPISPAAPPSQKEEDKIGDRGPAEEEKRKILESLNPQ